jgi:hypothetical protein
MAALTEEQRMKDRLWLLLAAAPVLVAWPAYATDLQHGLSLSGAASSVDARGELGYRVRSSGGWQLGVGLAVARPSEAYISGYPARGGRALYGAVLGVAPLLELGPLELTGFLSLGGRALTGTSTRAPDSSSFALTTRLGPVAAVHLTDSWSLRAGWLNVFDLQLRPDTAADAIGFVLLAGLSVAPAASLHLYADLETGGLVGYDGDGAKYLTRGTLGARWLFDDDNTWKLF